MKLMYLFFSITLLVLSGLANSYAHESEFVNEDHIIAALEARFTPEKPTVFMQYDVTYRFWGIRLARVAQAEIQATEGRWQVAEGTIPACFMTMTLRSCDLGARPRERSRVWINDRIISIVTMPELETLFYIKDTDEFIRPVLGSRRNVDFFSVYNLESDDLLFYEQNYITDTIRTTIEGSAELAAQGKEVADVLRMLSDVYHEKRPLITLDSEYRLLINCDGKTVPFAAETKRDELAIMGLRLPSIRINVEPAGEAPTAINNLRAFEMWASSFKDVAQHVDDDILIDLSQNTLEWAMTPLAVNYGMGIGYIHTELVSLKATCLAPHRDASMPAVAVQTIPEIHDAQQLK